MNFIQIGNRIVLVYDAHHFPYISFPGIFIGTLTDKQRDDCDKDEYQKPSKLNSSGFKLCPEIPEKPADWSRQFMMQRGSRSWKMIQNSTQDMHRLLLGQ